MTVQQSHNQAFLVAAQPKIVWCACGAIVLPSCRLAKGDSVACWQSCLIQFMPLSFLVAAWPKVIQKYADSHVMFFFHV
jgi:hypothetical protein